MKKLVCMILSMLLIVLLCACDNQNTESKVFNQEVTIVKMPSPPKCKTSSSVSVVNEVLATLAQIDKSPINKINGYTNGWEIMIKLNIDGQEFNYTIGGVFTDSDGTQYNTENLAEIREKINSIYDKIDTPEANYP